MLSGVTRGLQLAAAAAIATLLATGSIASSSGAYGGFTGAPGEDTCRHCHDTFPLNSGAGRLFVDGFPETYEPGVRYPVTVTLESDVGLRWGFQATVLSAREKPAGKLILTDREHTKLVAGIFFENRRYVEQRQAGSFEQQRGGASWTFDWQAPKRAKGPVTLYVASNVANGNGDKAGDFIFHLERTSQAPAE